VTYEGSKRRRGPTASELSPSVGELTDMSRCLAMKVAERSWSWLLGLAASTGQQLPDVSP
jgi:hypothetical protein